MEYNREPKLIGSIRHKNGSEYRLLLKYPDGYFLKNTDSGECVLYLPCDCGQATDIYYDGGEDIAAVCLKKDGISDILAVDMTSPMTSPAACTSVLRIISPEGEECPFKNIAFLRFQCGRLIISADTPSGREELSIGCDVLFKSRYRSAN